MSSNTLVAFCVACLFLLALATTILAFLDRRRVTHIDYAGYPPDDETTKTMPTHGYPQQ